MGGITFTAPMDGLYHTSYLYKELENLKVIEGQETRYCSIVKDEYKHPGKVYLFIYSNKSRTKLIKKIELRS